MHTLHAYVHRSVGMHAVTEEGMKDETFVVIPERMLAMTLGRDSSLLMSEVTLRACKKGGSP